MNQERETEIKNKVSGLLQEASCQNVFPVPVGKIITHLGYKLFKFSPSEKTKDISGAVYHNKKAIYINDNDAICRQFFTIAHEIGHIFLYDENENVVDYRSDLNIGSSEKELESNFFAANLLMPEDAFRTKWEEYKDYSHYAKTTLISNYFGVSDLAARVRANCLDLH
ncbi:MAG: ImmA/IrrE family metallo-endopeptidase [Gammaproteobacteria bacterium]|jgi:Zn-dependent peptidase ImmA (M78 family)